MMTKVEWPNLVRGLNMIGKVGDENGEEPDS